jgi:redox-sensitive bicupin YhaK (pirin superfamily)
MRGFQLWINLPSRDKMTDPRYQEFAPGQIAVATPAAGVKVKVIAGRVGDVAGPIAQPATDPTYLDIELANGATLTQALPADHAAFVYVYEGTIRIGDGESAKTVNAQELAVLGAGSDVRLQGVADVSHAILVAGRPLREPVAKYGPFVMNTQEEILRAVQDYQSGRF